MQVCEKHPMPKKSPDYNMGAFPGSFNFILWDFLRLY